MRQLLQRNSEICKNGDNHSCFGACSVSKSRGKPFYLFGKPGAEEASVHVSAGWGCPKDSDSGRQSLSSARQDVMQCRLDSLSQRWEEGTESFLKFTHIANWQKWDHFSLKHLLSKTSQSVNHSRATFTDSCYGNIYQFEILSLSSPYPPINTWRFLWTLLLSTLNKTRSLAWHDRKTRSNIFKLKGEYPPE